MRFSERHSFKPIKTSIQKESIDDDLRNALWSALKIYYWDSIYHTSGISSGCFLSDSRNNKISTLCNRLWLHYFKKPLDTLSDHWTNVMKEIRVFFFDCKWFEVYDFIEFVSQNYPDDYNEVNKNFEQICNSLLEREVSAYRFIDSKITPITSDEEIRSIEEALDVTIQPVQDHLTRSLQMLSDRKSPDYRNSIKEAISAVEALTKVVTGSDKGTLGQLLGKLETDKGLHPALKGAFNKLYGYTSDAQGIRHALMEEDTVTFEEAKFMLVACSAFTNYVIATNK